MPKKNRVASSRPAAPSSPPKTVCYGPATAGGAASGGGSALRGVDLVEQVAQSSKIQKQRWLECGLTNNISCVIVTSVFRSNAYRRCDTRVYTKLWERKAKVDIADAILIQGGTPRAWFFTSATTGVRFTEQPGVIQFYSYLCADALCRKSSKSTTRSSMRSRSRSTLCARATRICSHASSPC